MTIFDECKESLSDDFQFLSVEKELQVLKCFYQYPFACGNIDKTNDKVKTVSFDNLLLLINNSVISSDIYVLADMEGIPIFKTNLLLVLDKLDDVSALSTKVFLLGDKFLAQIVSRDPPLDIVELLEC